MQHFRGRMGWRQVGCAFWLDRQGVRCWINKVRSSASFIKLTRGAERSLVAWPGMMWHKRWCSGMDHSSSQKFGAWVGNGRLWNLVVGTTRTLLSGFELLCCK